MFHYLISFFYSHDNISSTIISIIIMSIFSHITHLYL